jgi:hypothetical protein
VEEEVDRVGVQVERSLSIAVVSCSIMRLRFRLHFRTHLSLSVSRGSHDDVAAAVFVLLQHELETKSARGGGFLSISKRKKIMKTVVKKKSAEALSLISEFLRIEEATALALFPLGKRPFFLPSFYANVRPKGGPSPCALPLGRASNHRRGPVRARAGVPCSGGGGDGRVRTRRTKKRATSFAMAKRRATSLAMAKKKSDLFFPLLSLPHAHHLRSLSHPL